MNDDCIERITNFWSSLTDAPKEFLKATAISVFSAALEDVPIEFGPTPLYPNLFFTLIGKTYDSRKKTVKELLTMEGSAP
jgi:hypothetical protein